MFNVVLVHPCIPPNTGNIARLCAAFRCVLHLIEPLGFELSDRYLKRAGLDYWEHVELFVHKSWCDYLQTTKQNPQRIFLYTTHADQPYYQVCYQPGDALVFGSETSGLPDDLHQTYPKQRYTISMDNSGVRSLNLSSAAAIVVAEAQRQIATRK